MDKERLMKYLSNAIDKGAHIEVVYCEDFWDTSEGEAKALAKEFADITEQEVVFKSWEHSEWYAVGNIDSRLRGTFFYNHYGDNLDEEEKEELPFADEDFLVDDEHVV